MKSRSALRIVGVLFLAIAAGCSDEIAMVRPGPAIPVVYGVLDVRDTVHSIKLSKSFAGYDDAQVLAKDPQNIFYKDAVVFIREVGGFGRYTFDLVDGLYREEGYFPRTPNQAYQLKARIHAGSYDLTIILPAEKDTLVSRFQLMDSFRVLNPKPGFKRFYFYDDPTIFVWSIDRSSGMYEITFTFTYLEYFINGDYFNRTLHFTRQLKPENLEVEKDHFNYRYFSDPFFAYVSSQVAKDNQVDYRKPVDLSIEITAMDTTLSRYLNWFDLEIDDRVNPNGNIPDAIGVIGSKNTFRYNQLIFSGRAQDSLVRGHYTRNLDFVANSEW